MRIKVHQKLVFLILSFFYLGNLNAQHYVPPVFKDDARKAKIEITFEKLDSLFKAYAKEHDFPSLSYGLVVDDTLVHSTSFGTINFKKNIKASPASAYHIASMTKSVTAMAILKLRDEGKLKLDDPLEKYLSEAKNLKQLTKDAPKITIRDLLTHHSGFPEDNPWGDRQLGQSDKWLKSLYVEGLNFSTSTGTAYEYSNLGFSTLGLVIKEITGETYQDYIRENIFKPLNMEDTYWEYENVPESQFVKGYRLEDGDFVEQHLLHSGAFGAMGGLITSVEDFSKYMALHLSAWPPRDDKDDGPIKRSSIREMHHPWNFAKVWTDKTDTEGKDCYVVDSYGYGLHHFLDCNGMVGIEHSGGLPGYGSRWRILPDYGVGIVIYGNRTYAPTGPILDQALNSLLKWADLKPRELPASEILEKRKNQLVEELPSWQDSEAKNIFADNFFDDNFISKLKKDSKKAFKEAGKIKSVSKVKPENQLRGYFIMKGEKKDIKVWFSLSPEPEPKIQAFKINVEE